MNDHYIAVYRFTMSITQCAQECRVPFDEYMAELRATVDVNNDPARIAMLRRVYEEAAAAQSKRAKDRAVETIE